MILGRGLTQGVDVWLNTPRRPHEASGTSGMKALMNGALNCSVMDGWWDEAFAPDLGWAIEGTSGSSDEEVDLRDHATIIQLLEGEIVPLFADRCSYGVPREWVRRMRAAMMRHGASFSADRMVREYARCYGGIIAPRG
jgi:starch phosphorylase